MVLPSRNFQPASSDGVVRLSERYLDDLQKLYKGSHGNAFAAYQLQQGVFYGIFADGKLASVAGTHIVSSKYGVAAVGNIYTQPPYRGLGYAQQTTSAVCQELIAQDLDVVLNVEQNNAPAIWVYKKLGFVEHCTFWEGIGDVIPKT
jgi:predicted GNAT family acetyltransferase